MQRKSPEILKMQVIKRHANDNLLTCYDFAESIEGQVFFAEQPVAVIPLEPSYVHPLMDEALFGILRANPSLHMVLVVPDTFMPHQKSRSSLTWARKLVRRLWDKYVCSCLNAFIH